jgi:hypothetical protein
VAVGVAREVGRKCSRFHNLRTTKRKRTFSTRWPSPTGACNRRSRAIGQLIHERYERNQGEGRSTYQRDPTICSVLALCPLRFLSASSKGFQLLNSPLHDQPQFVTGGNHTGNCGSECWNLVALEVEVVFNLLRALVLIRSLRVWLSRRESKQDKVFGYEMAVVQSFTTGSNNFVCYTRGSQSSFRVNAIDTSKAYEAENELIW